MTVARIGTQGLDQIPTPLLDTIITWSNEGTLLQTCKSIYSRVQTSEWARCETALQNFGIDAGAWTTRAGESPLQKLRRCKEELAFWVIDRRRYFPGWRALLDHLHLSSLCHARKLIQLSADGELIWRMKKLIQLNPDDLSPEWAKRDPDCLFQQSILDFRFHLKNAEERSREATRIRSWLSQLPPCFSELALNRIAMAKPAGMQNEKPLFFSPELASLVLPTHRWNLMQTAATKGDGASLRSIPFPIRMHEDTLDCFVFMDNILGIHSRVGFKPYNTRLFQWLLLTHPNIIRRVFLHELPFHDDEGVETFTQIIREVFRHQPLPIYERFIALLPPNHVRFLLSTPYLGAEIALDVLQFSTREEIENSFREICRQELQTKNEMNALLNALRHPRLRQVSSPALIQGLYAAVGGNTILKGALLYAISPYCYNTAHALKDYDSRFATALLTLGALPGGRLLLSETKKAYRVVAHIPTRVKAAKLIGALLWERAVQKVSNILTDHFSFWF